MADKKRIQQRTYRAVEGNWYKADVHLHTPASADWMEPGVTFLQWLQKAESRGLEIVAITDHNTVEGVARLRNEVERLTWLEANERMRPQERRDLDEIRRLGDKILVLPGFEFTATFGFHVLAIFPPETPLRTLELLLLRLNVPMDKLAEGSTEVGASTDVLTAYRLINEAGGLVIAAHANSTHGVAMRGINFGGQTKIAYTQDSYLDALEVTDLEDGGRRATATFFDGSKPEYPRRMHCIQGSDAHRLVRDPKDKNRPGIGDRVTELLLPYLSFEALVELFRGDDFTRTRPYRPLADVPFDHIEDARAQGNTIVQSFHDVFARDGSRLQKVLADVVAFANTSGGTVYLGASAARKGAPKGVEAPESAVLMLKRELERNIIPPIDVRVDIVPSQGVPVVRISVPNGADKPYALGQTRIYVRQEGETNEAVRDELVQLVLTGRQPVVVAEPQPAAAAAPVPAEVAAVLPVLVPVPEPVVAPVQAAAEDVQLPAVGVEIVSAEDRKGTRYFTIRDLRNGNVIQNVTLASARKLWSYAINQYLTKPVEVNQIRWNGEFGLWQAARRARKLRYDLALRAADGAVRLFYGVTADGLVGPWQQFLQDEDRGTQEEAAAEHGATPSAATTGTAAVEGQAKPRSRSRRGRGGVAEVQAEGQPEVAPQAKAPAEAKPETPTGGRARRGGRRPTAEAAPVVEAVVETPAVVVTPTPAAAVAPVETLAPEAVAKPKTGGRSRSRKPAVPPAEAIVEAPAPAAEVPATAKPKTGGQSRSRKPADQPATPVETPAPVVEVEAAAKPKTGGRSRSRKPADQPAAPAEAPAPAAEIEAAAKPKTSGRSRSRKPAAPALETND